ncbi:MAG TPA: LytR C-terminal domain-containing protein [Nocardioidaceae bacterium]|nr:LytR C-terminal domain-containing protein [Nocardioidaceae bacterium]
MGRREITTAITMLVLCGVLVAGAVIGWKSLSADLPGDEAATEEPSPSCTTEKVDAGQRIRSSQVQVSVYNGGTRSGLANGTLSALTKRGFKPGSVGNAPAGTDVKRVEVWSTEENDAAAQLVALQFGKSVEVTFSDVNLGPGVDVLVGNKFRGLAKAKRSLKVKTPEHVCAGTESSAPDTNAAG